MAIPFKKPKNLVRIVLDTEKSALTAHMTKRTVPSSTEAGPLLLASWNIANLGAQGRSNSALELIAHIMKRFDLIAVQEVYEEFRVFEKVVRKMGPGFEYIMTDTAGNDERLAFVYRTKKVLPLNLFGELALRAHEFPKHTVRVRYRDGGQHMVDIFPDHRFVPFDRNPFIGSFAAGNIRFVLVNTHLYFGKFQNSKKREEREKYARRVLEIFALARWAGRRANRKATYDRDIILMGDMNVPAMDENESTYKALIKFGYKPLDYVTKIGGSNLGNDKTYDQMAFAPGAIRQRIGDFGVFDFDKALFASLWKRLSEKHSKKKAIIEFNKHVRYHISDHRPLWVELRTD